jgi:predicted short-subunit dehydrogenase-like oxidoreductase (DUF2520 family)
VSSLGFIGCGRVGRTLAQAFQRAGHQVSGAWSRRQADARLMQDEVPGLRAMGAAQEVVDASDFLWLTVSDDAIAQVAGALNWSKRHRVVHCSGATEVAAPGKALQDGAAIGGFHPLQMFANPAVALAGLAGCTVAIEAQGDLLMDLTQLATAIGCRIAEVPPGQRALYHASAYYVGPFLIALLAEGAALWRSFGATDQQALQALLPLLRGTVSAVLDGGLAQGMGGCVARGDVGTVRKHLQALTLFDPEAAHLYRDLSLRTISLGQERGTLPAEAARRIREVLAREAPPTR